MQCGRSPVRSPIDPAHDQRPPIAECRRARTTGSMHTEAVVGGEEAPEDTEAHCETREHFSVAEKVKGFGTSGIFSWF